MTAGPPERGGFPSEEALRRWVEGLELEDEERARVAYTLLYRTCRPLLLAVARSVRGCAREAEDVVQKLFARLWEKRQDLGIDGSVRSYLLVSIYYGCEKAGRWPERMEALPEEPRQDGTVVGVGRPSGLYGPAADLHTLELVERFEEAWAALSDDRRQALELKARGLTNVEIGEFMGKSTAAATMLIFHARKDLDAFMGWLHEEAGDV